MGVFLALNCSYNYLILVLAAINSAQGVKTLIILFLEVFKSPIAALLTTIFLGIVVQALDNFG